MNKSLDKTTLALFALTAVLYLAIYKKSAAAARSSAGEAGELFLETLPKLVIGFLLGAILPALFPKAAIEGWLSDRSGWRGHLVGWAAGSLFPFGAPFVLYPMAAGLMKGGAGLGPVVTFLTASSLFGPFRLITYELPILGLRFSLLRALAVLWMPPVAGYLAQWMAGPARGSHI